ncbi:lysophospholipid transporter LplT [Rhizobacter sp. AJA081-3]|uniref:lysophospholipid transporter LplT n=1 Tax=Rhizobacter sp. AJA081-3 TaxID=2753607 RepID=UPI001ADF0C5B|nr:lysophospholipid transporter LplT [Rhizobacter sp. AJA081-3]QTN23572.1 lysophospholipid transporter LplT [Rhizobacter sp. AJA081-3]
MPAGFHRLIAAQFFSALADNALLIVTMALLQARGAPAWWAPLLKFGFTLSYVFLAPLVGPLADAMPKARLMAWMNGVKVLGVIGLLAGINPIAAFAVIGFGAAAYAPAKYGLVTEMVTPGQLVAANGWLEVTVVCAVLLGTVLGGALVSPALQATSLYALLADGTQEAGVVSAGASAPALLMLLGVYALASALNLGIPDSGARYAARSIHPVAMLRDFAGANLTLWRDAQGGLSLAATTLFWGAGATLQFAVLRWAQDHLGLPLHQASYLQAAVAVGVVAGAAAAGRWVPLARARRMLAFGVGLGLLLPVVALTNSVWLAVPLLMLAGAVGGLMVVPLNALLQHRGCELLSAGRSIAVQGFNENASILVMLGVYAAMVAADVPIVPLLCGFGGLIAVAILLLMRRTRRMAE